jgi:hypothetical protein
MLLKTINKQFTNLYISTAHEWFVKKIVHIYLFIFNYLVIAWDYVERWEW